MKLDLINYAALVFAVAMILNMILVLSAHAEGLERGDLNTAANTTALEQSIAVAEFKLELNKTQTDATIVAEQE